MLSDVFSFHHYSCFAEKQLWQWVKPISLKNHITGNSLLSSFQVIRPMLSHNSDALLLFLQRSDSTLDRMKRKADGDLDSPFVSPPASGIIVLTWSLHSPNLSNNVHRPFILIVARWLEKPCLSETVIFVFICRWWWSSVHTMGKNRVSRNWGRACL